MKYALISPNEPRNAGYRVADVAGQPFDVAQPLFWIECEDEVATDKFWFDPIAGELKPFSVEPEPAPEAQPE